MGDLPMQPTRMEFPRWRAFQEPNLRFSGFLEELGGGDGLGGVEEGGGGGHGAGGRRGEEKGSGTASPRPVLKIKKETSDRRISRWNGQTAG